MVGNARVGSTAFGGGLCQVLGGRAVAWLVHPGNGRAVGPQEGAGRLQDRRGKVRGRGWAGGQEALPAGQEERDGEAACSQKFGSQLRPSAPPTCAPGKASPL